MFHGTQPIPREEALLNHTCVRSVAGGRTNRRLGWPTVCVTHLDSALSQLSPDGAVVHAKVVADPS
jgi:hypothetical protein